MCGVITDKQRAIMRWSGALWNHDRQLWETIGPEIVGLFQLEADFANLEDRRLYGTPISTDQEFLEKLDQNRINLSTALFGACAMRKVRLSMEMLDEYQPAAEEVSCPSIRPEKP